MAARPGWPPDPGGGAFLGGDVGKLHSCFTLALELVRLAAALRAPPPSLGRTVLALAGLVAAPLPANPPPTSSGAPRRGLGLQRFLLPHLACRVQGVKGPPLDPTSAPCAATVSACLAPPRDGCPDASPGGWLRAMSKNSRRKTRKNVAASAISSLRVEAGSERATSEAETDEKDAHEDYEALRENARAERVKDPDRGNTEPETEEKDAQEVYVAVNQRPNVELEPA